MKHRDSTWARVRGGESIRKVTSEHRRDAPRALAVLFALGLVAVLFTAVACDDDGDSGCPSLYGQDCGPYGLTDGKALCDSCGQVWVCEYYEPLDGEPGLEVYSSAFPCSCIRDDGYLYNQFDTASPRECQSTLY